MRILFVGLIFMFLSGCVSQQTPKKKIIYIYKRLSIDGWWKLSKIDNFSLSSNKEIKLFLDKKDKKFYGTDSCNSILGALEKVTQDMLVFGGIATTMVACEDMKTPRIYLNALESVRFYKVEDPKLFLYDKDKNLILEFIKTKN